MTGILAMDSCGKADPVADAEPMQGDRLKAHWDQRIRARAREVNKSLFRDPEL